MSVFSSSAFDQHELVAFHCDPDTGLRAIIAVHDSSLGAGVGGCRMYPYADDEAALEDVLRLSRGMTYKSALAGLPFGGGKSVIIGDPAQDKTPDFLRAMGDFIHAQGGRYVAAEDSGTGVDDIRIMHERTPYVSGIDDNEFGGDPSPHTAFGVYLGILTAVQHRLGQDDLSGLSVAVQGLGHVGYHLARLLVRAGAHVVAADMNDANLARAVREFGVEPVGVEDILYQSVDVLAPCAMGAVLNQQVIPRIRAGIVAGAANNQLATINDGADLQGRGILYCPDFLINAGGIIDVHHQRMGSANVVKQEHILRISESLAEVLRRAAEAQVQTHLIAEALAMERLRSKLSETTTLAA